MKRSWRNVAVALTAASFLAFFEILRMQLTRVFEGHRVTLDDLGTRLFSTWFLIVLVSPWCAFMAQRFPFRPGRLPVTILAHLGGGIVFAALHLLLMIAHHMGVLGARNLSSLPQLFHTWMFYAALEMSVYLAIVLVVLFLEARRESAERAVATARLAES